MGKITQSSTLEVPEGSNAAASLRAASRDHIRVHLSHVVEMFSAGNFNIPMFIHDTTPPGRADCNEAP
jgi:hypothetical protein